MKFKSATEYTENTDNKIFEEMWVGLSVLSVYSVAYLIFFNV